MLLSSLKEFLNIFCISLELWMQLALDKLYLIHENFQNNERKVNNSFTQYQVLESIFLSMKKAILIAINLV